MMKAKILIKCFVFSLMMMFLISSAESIKTQEELLRVLDSESSKVALRALHALRNKHKVDLSVEFSTDTPKRSHKTEHVFDLLFFVINKKIKKIGPVYVRSLEKFQRELQGKELLAHKGFLDEWYRNKKSKYEQDKPSLTGTFENSEMSRIISDFVIVEEPASQILPTPSTSIPFGDEATRIPSGGYIIPAHVDPDALAVLSGFVILEAGEISTVIPSALAAMLADSTDSFSSLAALPSTSTETSLVLEDAPSPSAPSTSTETSPALVAADTALTLVGIPSTLTEHNELLSTLDEEGAKIVLQAILTDYQIPLDKFNFNSQQDQNRYWYIVNYLMWILNYKKKIVLHKKTALVPDSPRYAFDQYWYETKLKKYESLLEMFSPPASLERPQFTPSERSHRRRLFRGFPVSRRNG